MMIAVSMMMINDVGGIDDDIGSAKDADDNDYDKDQDHVDMTGITELFVTSSGSWYSSPGNGFPGSFG